MRQFTHPIRHAVGALILASPFLAAAQQVERITDQGQRRTEQNKAAQQRIDRLSDQSGELVTQYRTVSKIVDGLKVYNGLLQKQIDNQQEEIDALQESIGNVALIERQIVPLMVRMIDSLEQFIDLDVPFLSEERIERVQRLRAMMERSDVTAAEKFRRVLEAYQIENEYGRTIESYKGTLKVADAEREVDFLRVGRVTLLYQTVGGEYTGVWERQSEQWRELPPEQYKQHVAQGLRIARKQVAPDLLVLPIDVPRGIAGGAAQ